jgi:hypothetical protein
LILIGIIDGVQQALTTAISLRSQVTGTLLKLDHTGP